MVWVNPLAGRITSGFGPRWGGIHSGTDIAAPGSPLIGAANDGTVIKVRTGSYRGDRRPGALAGRTGNGVVIDHGGGIWTYYGHLSAVLVRVGQHVSAGNAIGRQGATGNVTGPHLHFEFLPYGPNQPVDPVVWMRARGVSLGYGRTSTTQVNYPPPTAPVATQMQAAAQYQPTTLSFSFTFTMPTLRNTSPVRR